jgi:class 3 adenylate cyclase
VGHRGHGTGHRRGGGPLGVSNDLADRIAPVMEQSILAMYHVHQARAWTANVIEAFEVLMDKAGIHSRLVRLLAICFLDISGFTLLTQERGDDAATDLAVTVERLVQRTSVQRGGKPIKWLGDGVMFTSATRVPAYTPRSRWWTVWPKLACRQPTSAYTRGPSCSRRATTSARR